MPVAAYESGVASGDVADDPPDVGLGGEPAGQAVENDSCRLAVNRHRTRQGHGKELADRAREPLAEQVICCRGFGGMGAAAANVQPADGVTGVNRGERAHGGPHGHDHPAPAHQAPGGELQQTQSLPPSVGVIRRAAKMLDGLAFGRQRAGGGGAAAHISGTS